VRASQLESENALVVEERRRNLDYEIVPGTSNKEQENRVRNTTWRDSGASPWNTVEKLTF